MSQVSDGKSERVLRARLLLNCVLVSCSYVSISCSDLMRIPIDPLHGAPCFPFYRPRESAGYSGGKGEEREREEGCLCSALVLMNG